MLYTTYSIASLIDIINNYDITILRHLLQCSRNEF